MLGKKMDQIKKQLIHRYLKESDKETSNTDLSKTDCFHPAKDRTTYLIRRSTNL